jgi:Kef-type K+ transport system membrane component KefB
MLPDSDLPDPSRRILHSVFLGIALSISALPVIARTLLDLGLLKTDVGLLVISAAAFDDILGWTGFSVLSRQVQTGVGGILQIASSLGLTLLFVAAALILVRPAVNWLLARIQSHSEVAPGRVLSMVMVLSLTGAGITEALGMHAVFGGLVMGLAIGDSSRLREHTRKVLEEFVTSVFTPVFFATMALRVDFAASFDLRLILIVIAISCLAKIAGCTVGARLAGVGWRHASAVGFGMNSRGAMEILLAVLALEAKIINAPLFVALIVMALATSLISGPGMRHILRGVPDPVLGPLRDGVVLLELKDRP